MYKTSCKSVQWKPSFSMRTDGRKDKAKITVAFHNFLKTSNNLTFNISVFRSKSTFSVMFRLSEHGGFLSLTHMGLPQNKCDRASSCWQTQATNSVINLMVEGCQPCFYPKNITGRTGKELHQAYLPPARTSRFS